MIKAAMKKILITATIVTALFSCSKSPTGIDSQQSAPPPDLSSVKLLSTGVQVKDSFEYNAQYRIARLLQYDFDSTGIGSPIADSEIIVFTFSGTNDLPASYTFTHDAVTRTHLLSYNSQSRIIKDTCSATHYAGLYTYPGNNIVSTVLSNGTTASRKIDTLLFNNSGDIDSINFYIPATVVTADSLLAGHGFGFSVYSNPAYYAPVANTIGPLLFSLIQDYDNYGDGSITDFLSRHAMNGVYFYNTQDQFSIEVPLTIYTGAETRVSLITYPDDDHQRLVYTYYQ
jgi:hypothetical protein